MGKTSTIFEDIVSSERKELIHAFWKSLHSKDIFTFNLLKLSEDLQLENEQYRSLLAENEKAQNTFKEAVTKAEDAKKILAQAKALNDTFDKCARDKVSHVKRNMEADMKGRLQTALQKQTVTLST